MDGNSRTRKRRERLGQSREDYSTEDSESTVRPQQEHALQPDCDGGVSASYRIGTSFRGLDRI